jgi:NAD(P)-dependent dehydrogenase (short-subunit alcohol dehydrogenase family)
MFSVAMSVPTLPAPSIAGAARAGRLAGQLAVVTGGARGIGAEIARAFAAHGARVAVLDVLVDEARRHATEIGGVAIGVDLREPLDVQRAMAEAIEGLGGIDILVNNAGVLRFADILDITVDEWNLTFDVNVRSMLLTTQVAVPTMRERGGGRIVNMASMGGKTGAPGQAHYAASKAAVISFTRVCAMEFGPWQINVNCICPGYVLTEMGAATRTPDKVAAWTARSPLGRLAETADVANMALFLAGDESSYCTGQAMNVSGGMVMH